MRLRYCLILLAPLLVTACADDMSDLRDYAEEIKQRPGAGIPPVPEFEPYESFIYSSRGLRDPFEPRRELADPPATAEEDEDAIRPDRDRPREPLERYPLDSLRMVGTLDLKNQKYGLIRSPDGTVHQVVVGNYMGENHGHIQEIDSRAIRVVEIIPDGDDGWMERDASVGLGE